MMNKIILYGFILLAGCASKPETSTEARGNLEEELKDRVGVATKTEFVEKFGHAEWCDPKPTGEESCRFHKKTGTRWIGAGLEKKSIDIFDQVVAEFDSSGRLRTYEVKSQR